MDGLWSQHPNFLICQKPDTPVFVLNSWAYAVFQTHLQSQRVLLLQGTDSLNRASQSIERSHRIAAETDQIGTDIIEELGEQREQLERTKSRVSRETMGIVLKQPGVTLVGTVCQ